jgi:HlyD family secretion protein
MNDPTPPKPQPSLDEFLGVEPQTERSRWIRIGAIAAVVIVLGLILVKCFGGSDEPAYFTQDVKRGDLNVSVSATGNIAPTNQIDVGSELSGLIEQVLVDDNDRVTRGQVLAVLDTSKLDDAVVRSRAALAASQASVAQARASLAESRASLSRLQEVSRLSGGKVPAKTEMEAAVAAEARAKANLDAAIAGVAQARAQLSSDDTNRQKAAIRSPVAGVVLSRQVEPGQTVAASFQAPVLFTIAEDLTKMQLEVSIDEADVGQVKAGQNASFTVDAFPNRTFPARIQRVNLGANSSTSSSGSGSSSSAASASTVVAYTAVLEVANPDESLRPGMTATADIRTEERRNVLLVPNAALRFKPSSGDGNDSSFVSSLTPRPPRSMRGARSGQQATIGRGSAQTVYVLGDDGEPKAVQITAGASNGGETEVTGGALKQGMKVITGKRATAE